MNSPAETPPSEFFVITRDEEGNYLQKIEDILHAHGIDQFTETTRKPRIANDPRPEDPILGELSRILPSRVQFVSDERGESPFMVLEVGGDAGDNLIPGCACKCGTAYTCGGGGGGH